MKRFPYYIRRLEKTLLFCVKILMLLALFTAFFGLFSFHMPQLAILNRTSVVSYITFAVATALFIRIYGGFPIGFRRSRDIANSVFLATIMGDVITFIVVYVMGISEERYVSYTEYLPMPPNAPTLSFSQFLGHYFRYDILPGLGMLILVLIVQYFIIRVFTSIANTYYFKINPPKSVLIVYNEASQVPLFSKKIARYESRWKVSDVVRHDEEDIRRHIRSSQVIFFLDVPKDERDQLIEYCYKHNKDIFCLPDVSDIILNHASHFVVDDTTMFSSTTRSMSFEQLVIKRVCDVLFSLLSLILFSPVMLIIAAAIKIGDRGPVFYKQERLTKGGRTFSLLKFRSMVVDAEKKTGAILAKQKDDRITPVGRVLRRFRLDELPQLFNILKGDMSVVGPRPERPEIAKEYGKELPEFRYRLKVKAGLTGLAQIMSKYNTTPKDKLALDLEYIERYSFWLDVKLTLKTLLVFIKPDSVQGIQEETQE